jgi:hypothetical protein
VNPPAEASGTVRLVLVGGVCLDVLAARGISVLGFWIRLMLFDAVVVSANRE